MGNNKFKLSDMIPNSWFYKLRDMGKNNRYRKNKTQVTSSSSSSSISNSSSLFSSSLSTNSNSISVPTKVKQTHLSQHRKSYYFTRDISPPRSHSPNFEKKLQNSPNKSPRVKHRGNRVPSEKPNYPISVSSDSENSFAIMNSKSFDSKFDFWDPISENKSANSPIIFSKANISIIDSEKPISPIPISADSENHFCKSNINSHKNKFDGFQPNSKTKLPVSPIRTPKERIRNRVLCDKPNSQIPIPSDSENSTSNTDFQNLNTNAGGYRAISKTKLPRIITKKETLAKKEKKIIAPKKQRSTPVLGVRLRSNSPKIGNIKENGRKSFSSGGRRKLPESFAVVKSSSDPQKDFKESMVEMILQNNINGSKELEDLLACYLQLNCDEYHEMIIKVFKQIWFELAIVMG